MRASKYEVHSLCKRAFAGLGFVDGADDDAAAMVAWAEVNGLRGLQRLAAVLDGLDGSQSGRLELIARDRCSAELDAGGQSVLAVGPAAVELAGVLAAASDRAEVLLRDCRDQPFAVSLAAGLAARGQRVELRWREGDELLHCCCDGGAARLYRGPADGAIAADLLQIRVAPAGQYSAGQYSAGQPPADERPADWSLDADIAHCALARGIQPPEALWQSLLGYGQRRLVPATEASRQRGAGGGDAND